jgi:hypothetical protein
MSLRIVALDDYQGLVEQMGLAGRLAGELQGAGLDGELAGFELVAVREHLAAHGADAAPGLRDRADDGLLVRRDRRRAAPPGSAGSQSGSSPATRGRATRRH